MMGGLSSIYKWTRGETKSSSNDRKKEKDLNIIDDQKMDPSLSLVQPNYTNFDVHEYIRTNSEYTNMTQTTLDQDYIFKTECYYLIKFETVYGTLVVKKDCLIFEPSEDPEHNAGIRENTEVKIADYGSVIDYFDICEISKLPLVNEKAVLSENSFI